MRLLTLSANKESFHVVKFNPTGVSLIVGERKQETVTARNNTRTYNGVGKSLLIELLHYCLGSNANPEFKKHLPGWVFSLAVEVDQSVYVISRSADKPSEIAINGEERSLKQLRQWLCDACFEPLHGVKGLTFRSLISPFLRSGRSAYDRFDRATEGDTVNPYTAMLRTAFLLGLDLQLAQTKYRLRTRHNTLTKTIKELEADPLFAELFQEDKAGVELTALREEESRLEEDLKSFRVADDYAAIEQEANTLKREADSLRREIAKLGESIAQVDKSLESRGDVSTDLVERVYKEASLALPERVVKQIHEVLKFQADLQKRRVFRLTREKQSFLVTRMELQAKLTTASGRQQELLQFLGTHVALDEYLAVNQRLNEIKHRIARLEASSAQRERVTRELNTIARDLAEQSVRTDDYLDTAQRLVEEANVVFRTFTKDLYGNRGSGLTVNNDSGENLQRYKIDAHIVSDAAEGINEAKIFCFDLMALTLQRGHSLSMLVHDSTLFHPIDARQRWSMLKLANKVAKAGGLQYIATLNQDDIASIVSLNQDDTQLQEVFSDENIVLRLTDTSAKDKLLGIDVDMNYRERADKKPADVDET